MGIIARFRDIMAANINALGIAFEDAEIDYNNPAIGNIINNIFGLNYLNLGSNTADIITALAATFNMNLEGVEKTMLLTLFAKAQHSQEKKPEIL